MFYDLMAMTVDGELFPFSLKDGPCPLSEDTFFLSNRPGTPILKYSIILRSVPDTDMFDGDIISYLDEIYTVKYHRGFNCISSTGKIIDIPLDNYNIINNVYKLNKELKTPLPKYKIGKNYYCTIRKFYGVDKGKGLLINDRNIGYVSFGEVYQYAGVKSKNKKLYFKKNKVELIHGRILTIN